MMKSDYAREHDAYLEAEYAATESADEDEAAVALAEDEDKCRECGEGILAADWEGLCWDCRELEARADTSRGAKRVPYEAGGLYSGRWVRRLDEAAGAQEDSWYVLQVTGDSVHLTNTRINPGGDLQTVFVKVAQVRPMRGGQI